MIPIRHSPAPSPNAQLKRLTAKTGETNRQWLARVQAFKAPGDILLLGGNSLEHFRIRCAQAHLRSDLLPSFWSFAGLLLDEDTFVSVPLSPPADLSQVPAQNGVQICQLADYDDPARFPNVGVLRFPTSESPLQLRAENEADERNTIELVRRQRTILDLPGLILPWLGYVWGVGMHGNPLLEAKGLPSAAFIETVYGLAGIELTPGLSSASSCPEAIWQAAKWWHQFYQQQNAPAQQTAKTTPSGVYFTRQPAAAVVE